MIAVRYMFTRTFLRSAPAPPRLSSEVTLAPVHKVKLPGDCKSPIGASVRAVACLCVSAP